MVKVADKKVLVTSALPYIHGLPHLGNLVGSILPAEVYSRYRKLKGDECIFICGSDAHGTPIEVAAFKEGISAEEYASRGHKEALEVLKKYNMEFDYYGTTHGDTNKELTYDIFTKLYDNGHIKEKTETQAYCPTCDKFLSDRWIEGKCPKCGGLGRGDQCDDCGALLTPEELIDPKCVQCGKTGVVFKETKNLYLDLPQFEPFLKEWITGHEDWPPNARNTSLSWIKDGLHQRCITRDIKWGFPVPIKGFENKVIYVWFDAPIGYIAFTKELGDVQGDKDYWKKWWQSDDVELVQYLGKDNIPFHAIIFPAMLKGTNDPYHLADYIASCSWLQSTGVKFSKSRGIGLNVENALQIRNGDVWRFVLLSLYPANKDSEFTWEEFQSIVNNDLADTLGNYIHRVFKLIHKYYGGKVPDPKEFNIEDNKLIQLIKDTPLEVTKEYDDKMRFREAITKTLVLAREGNAYLTLKEPWKTHEEKPDKTATTLYVSINVVRSLAILLEPLMPEVAKTIWNYLNEPKPIRETGWDSAGDLNLEPGRLLKESQVLFQKIDDKELEKLKSQFASKEKKTGVKPMVKYDDFAKLDFRVAKIVTAEKIEGKDKLLKLTVDVGEENPRTMVAGIAKKYDPKDLPGRQIVVIVNLEPATIAGIKSEAMLLAAGKEDDFALVTVDSERKTGEQVL
ncbi:MAG: methionine--tRNA ligase [Candidatus Diapherotrites archaeon]|nr:methionine--tRNA ligase [Candidatus Diapherotrites archaeon]